MNAAAVSGALPVQLDPDALYRAPSGRLCRVSEVERAGPRRSSGVVVAHLEYTEASGHRAATNMADGFTLSRENWRLLQVAG